MLPPTIYSAVEHGQTIEEKMIEIIWNSLSPDAWEARFATIKRSTLTQSYAYARAVAPQLHLRGRWGLIMRGEQEAGLAQLLEGNTFGGILSALILDRGPLWFDGYGTQADWQGFLTAMDKEFPHRFGRRRRLILELEDNPAHRTATEHLKPNKNLPGYQTAWVDLTADAETLRSNMRRDIRQRLKKAEETELEIQIDLEGKSLKSFLLGYAADKARRGYPGPDVKTLAAFARTFLRDKKLLLMQAVNSHEVLAVIYILIHGQSATYQAGWTTDAGREVSAHHLLLFKAMQELKNRGVNDLDLGGIRTDGAAKGIADFKLGLGGQPMTYLNGFY
ncbi:MAG: GNAT family N-acetyltransferase [Alphaproteobacteria bacterium]|nr:GNAT family N-acetyltransferase [Alphaproteobacteria bacterium]